MTLYISQEMRKNFNTLPIYSNEDVTIEDLLDCSYVSPDPWASHLTILINHSSPKDQKNIVTYLITQFNFDFLEKVILNIYDRIYVPHNCDYFNEFVKNKTRFLAILKSPICQNDIKACQRMFNKVRINNITDHAWNLADFLEIDKEVRELADIQEEMSRYEINKLQYEFNIL